MNPSLRIRIFCRLCGHVEIDRKVDMRRRSFVAASAELAREIGQLVHCGQGMSEEWQEEASDAA